jgi:hypothetical protein
MLSQFMSQRDILCIVDDRQVEDPILRSVFSDLMEVTCLLNGGRTCFRMNPYAYQEVCIYCFLHFRVYLTAIGTSFSTLPFTKSPLAGQ